jgi:hypothetical protein
VLPFNLGDVSEEEVEEEERNEI